MKKLMEQVKKWLVDAKAGKEVPEADLTAALVLTTEDVTAFLETEDGKKLILPRIDQGVSKGVEAFKKNNLEKLVEERFNALHPPETDDQKRTRKLEQDLAEEKNARVRESLKNKLITEATKKGLPTDLVDHLIGADEDVSLKNLGLFEQVFTTKLNDVVKERLAAGGFKPAGGGGAGAKTFTQEQMKDPAFVNANWPDIQAAMAAGTIKKS